jgi:two-component system NtrC family sensor kinase
LEQAVQAGASAFLTKPVREDDLERALELAVARFADLQEIRRLRADAEARVLEAARQTQELERVVRELRAAQLQLVNAARRAAVASLAHGLAHEINNALTPIIGNAQIIAMLSEREPEAVERAQNIMQYAQRIAGWTASFRQVTMGGTRASMPFSLNGIVNDVLGLYADRLQRLDIRAGAQLDATLPPMYGHPDQMQEVLMNLIQNAIEAMRGGGALWLTTRHDEPDASAALLVDDTGSGIAPEHLPHIFEPGFTTKATEEQSIALGWGLFTVNQIVQAHGGEVRVSSPGIGNGVGTTVELRLPLQAPA